MIRSIIPSDKSAIQTICYRTGYHGADLTGRGVFSDRKLFAMRFAFHYMDFSPDFCFAALEKNRVIGYILDTLDTAAQKKDFAHKYLP